MAPSRFLAASMLAMALTGCMSLPRATCSDKDFADYIHAQAEKLPIKGIYELRTTAANGHVTLGGRVDSPETLKELVTAVAPTPGLCELSYFGMEFCPPDIPDDEIAARARAAACEAVGPEIANSLGYYCENHFLVVYGVITSLPNRVKIEDAMRKVPGVAQYHVSCEVILTNPPSDEAVVAAVKRKFRRPLEAPNLTFRASKVEVTSIGNVVYLTGEASTLLGKLSAGSQAAQVEGVRYVINRICVPCVRPTLDEPQPMPPAEEMPELESAPMAKTAADSSNAAIPEVEIRFPPAVVVRPTVRQ